MASGPPPPPPGQQTWLGRTLGVDPRQAGALGREMMGGLGAGLKSVGQNWNKPGLAAAAGSAGSAIGGAEGMRRNQFREGIAEWNTAIRDRAAQYHSPLVPS